MDPCSGRLRLAAAAILVPAALAAGWATGEAEEPAARILAVLGGREEAMAWDPVLLREGGRLWLAVAERDAAGRERATVLRRLDAELRPGAESPPPADWPPGVFGGGLEEEAARAAAAAGREWSSARLRRGRLLGDAGAAGWCPDLVRTAAGPVLAWDRWQGGDYDVLLREPDGRETVLAGSARAEFHPSLAADDHGRLWLAWDEAPEDWGRRDGLHGSRALRLVVREGEGPWRAVDLPEDLLDGGGQVAERPRLAVDGRGVLWLLVRVMSRQPDAGGPGCRRVVWQLRAWARTAAGWSRGLTLPRSDGGNADGLALLGLPEGGLLAAWESDGRLEFFPEVSLWRHSVSGPARVVLARLVVAGSGPAAGAAGAEWPTGRRARAVSPPPGDPDPELVPAGFQRLWGDLHRHSDLSRCAANEDGTVADQFRYALDVAGLDFLAVTDHYQHLTPASWAMIRGVVNVFDDPGRFTALHAFERVLGNGHRNMYCLDAATAAAAPFTRPEPGHVWDGFEAGQWVAIPHMLADRPQVEWEDHDPRFDREVEIFQGRRGGYEGVFGLRRDLRAYRQGKYVLHYLRAGRRFGFVGASDHTATLRGFTAVLVRANTRAEIFRALQERRCYAATVPMALDLRLGELLMGQEGPVAPDAPLHLRVAAGGEIARVDVIRNGRLARSWHGQGGGELLTLRLGRVEGARRLTLVLEDAAAAGPLRPFLLEAGDRVRVDETGHTVTLELRLGAMDEDGLILPVAVAGEGAAAVLRNARGQEQRLDLAEARRHPLPFQFAGAGCELRLDPPPLGHDRLEEEWRPGDWKPGDWCYLRVLRSDGEAAWTSPVWVTAPR